MFVEEEQAVTAMPDRKSLDFRLITITPMVLTLFEFCQMTDRDTPVCERAAFHGGQRRCD